MTREEVIERVARAIHTNWEVKKKGKPWRFEDAPPHPSRHKQGHTR